VFAPVEVLNRLKSPLHVLRVIKDAKPQGRRALLASDDDDLIKAIVECAKNTLNVDHKKPKTKRVNCVNIRIFTCVK